MKNYTQNKRGFTLVEMALVLVVIGIVIGIGAGMIGPLMSLSKTRETKEFLGSTVESVNSWAASSNSLPNTAGFASVAKSPNDAWGRNFIYLFDNSLYAAAPTKDTICGRKTTPLSIVNNGVSPAVTITNIAFAIISQGEDALTQTTLNGTLNGAAINGVITGSGTATGTITLDANVSDIVRWVTLDELRTKVGCQGAQLRITTNELPFGYNNTAYSANVYADGGVPFSSGGKYSWCIQTSLGDIATPATITFKNTGGANIPFKTSCSSAVAVQSDNLVIGGTPVIPAVTGTDSKVYSCSQGHVAAAVNRPISGANYAQYWQLAASGITGVTWVSGTAYYPATSNNITVYSYDSAGNSAYKSFVFTINPQ
jgi:prepilin-type N-terminal cleavage/methylation domain-containing protein